MTDKEKIEKLSSALRLILLEEGGTLQDVLESLEDPREVGWIDDPLVKTSILVEAVQIILQDEKEPPKVKMELYSAVGAKQAAYKTSQWYGRCLRGCILNVDYGDKMVLVGGTWETKPKEPIALWVHEADLCEPEPA